MIATAPRRQQKTSLVSLLRDIKSFGIKPDLTTANYTAIFETGLRSKNLAVAAIAAQIARDQQPLTLRSLFYQCVSAGVFPSTDKEHYSRLGRVTITLREEGILPFRFIVDNMRTTIKPSSWSGLNDFGDTVRNAYRKDFWASLDEYVHVFVEKDAIAGTIAPVTREFDVALTPIRGYASLSCVHEIAETWNEIKKPIHAFYLGDFDPSGMDIERDLKAKLFKYSSFASWKRLGINQSDIVRFKLIPLEAKKKDRRYSDFIDEHGLQCVEVDALPPNELRRRVRKSIEQYIPKDRWENLKQVEQMERDQFNQFLDGMGQGNPE